MLDAKIVYFVWLKQIPTHTTIYLLLQETKISKFVRVQNSRSLENTAFLAHSTQNFQYYNLLILPAAKQLYLMLFRSSV